MTIHLERIGVAELLYADTNRVDSIELQLAAVGLSAKFGMAHIFELHDAVRRVLDDDSVEFVRRTQSSRCAHGDLEILFPVRRRLSELTRCDDDVLLPQRIDHIGGRENAGGQARRIEPDAHGVFALAEYLDVANTGYALQRVLYIDVEIVADE